ncbi:MAG: hypothetical protein F6K19_38395 [Cyanothece sp. SIO1E1]|nr:hypothetical protein [Cyanothece sp. SIO1E1]
MEDWPKNFFQLFDVVTDEAEQFLLDVAQEAGQAVDDLIEFSDAILEQLETNIHSEIDQFQYFLESFLETLGGFEETIDETSSPIRNTVEPMLQQHSACIGCHHYHGQVYGGNLLVCAMHPYGPELESCSDWESTWKNRE